MVEKFSVGPNRISLPNIMKISQKLLSTGWTQNTKRTDRQISLELSSESIGITKDRFISRTSGYYTNPRKPNIALYHTHKWRKVQKRIWSERFSIALLCRYTKFHMGIKNKANAQMDRRTGKLRKTAKHFLNRPI